MTALDTATERLNGLLTEAEKIIAGIKFGVNARVQLNASWDLGFGKYDTKWRLVAHWHGLSPAGGEEETTQPLINAPREVRVLAANLFNTLIIALQHAQAEHQGQVEKACEYMEIWIKDHT